MYNQTVDSERRKARANLTASRIDCIDLAAMPLLRPENDAAFECEGVDGALPALGALPTLPTPAPSSAAAFSFASIHCSS